MCRSTAAPLMAMAGVAGTALGLALAVVRERIDARADSKAAEEETARHTTRSRNGTHPDRGRTAEEKKSP